MAYVKCIRNLVSSTVPDGKTVTPTDDISIWLACGGRSETYTTLSEVLNDSVCLSALIADSNAVDYLGRSTTWASGITADSSAMSYIGLNNYASNTLLADSTWCSAICNSAYFESVLNVKVPTMTSATTPEGEVIRDAEYTAQPGWHAFDNNPSTTWTSTSNNYNSTVYIGYKFTERKKIYLATFTERYNTDPNYNYGTTIVTIKYQGSNDGSTWVDLTSGQNVAELTNETVNKVDKSAPFTTHDYQYFRCLYVAKVSSTYSGNIYPTCSDIQFYGRADI